MNFHPGYCRCYSCEYYRQQWKSPQPASQAMQVGYMPYTYDAPDWAEQQFHIPEKVTVNWGEVIVGAVIGALLTRVLR